MGKWVIATVALLSCALPSGADSVSDARQFVQAFYNWYLPFVLDPHADSLARAINEKPRVFTEELLRALKADVAAQKGADEIVSVSGSFDPFTDS